MKRFSLVSLIFTASLAGAAVWACNVPVFRYALERWPADLYEVVILHEGELNRADQARLETLQRSSRESSYANYKVGVIELGNTQDDLLKDLWNEHADGGRPLMIVFYPRAAREVPDRLVGVHRLSDQAIERLVDSPVRRAAAGKLLGGDSAVWIFVPSGHADQDAAALKTLKEQVKQNQEHLELPPQDEIESDEFFRAETPIELRLGFSIVTLNRDDPEEQLTLQMLLGSEPDLEELDEPMAFPMIGRGRVLYALVGKGIYPDTIAMASRFVVGPCSCQVKDQNPGFDLLLAVDWDEKLGGSVVSEPQPPESAKPILVEIPKGK